MSQQIVIKCSDPIYPIQETCLEIFPGKLIWFGTDESCDIVLDKDNGDVYPEHAYLAEFNNLVYLMEGNPRRRKSILVNDKKIELCQALYSGDSIKFGKNQPEFIIYLERSLLKTKNSPRVNQARPKSYFLMLVCKLKSG